MVRFARVPGFGSYSELQAFPQHEISRLLWAPVPFRLRREAATLVPMYANPDLDQSLEQGQAVGDPEQHKQVYDRVQDILVEEVPYIYVWHRVARRRGLAYRPSASGMRCSNSVSRSAGPSGSTGPCPKAMFPGC